MLGDANNHNLPDQTSGAGPKHLLVETGKEGVVYLIDRDNMGQVNPTSNDQIVQSFPGPRTACGALPRSGETISIAAGRRIR